MRPLYFLVILAISFTSLTSCGENAVDVADGGNTPTYTVGGVVSGLSGTLVLQNNGGDNLEIAADSSFAFSTALVDGSLYAVTVLTQPWGQTCTVTGGAGIIAGADVTDVAVDCDYFAYTVGGMVSGLSGTLVLQNNGGDNLEIATDGTFEFSTALVDGSAYTVTVLTQPWGQTCTVTGGAGIIAGADVTDVALDCVDSGTLDGSFGSDGTVFHQYAGGGTIGDIGYSITTDSDGRILVAGESGDSSGSYDMVIWRYNADGTLDNTFDGDGIVVQNRAAGGPGRGVSITTDLQGRILVTGFIVNGSGSFDMVIWRYNADGTLDSTFDGDGIVVHDNAAGGNGFDGGNSIIVDSQGRIVVGGYSYNSSSNFDMVIWRYNADGTLDSTFDGDGIVVHDNAAGGNDGDGGSSIVIDSQGRIVVAGSSINSSGNRDMVIWRYNADGTLDSTFDGDGIVVHDNAAGGTGDDGGSSIVIDLQGRIVVGGYSYNSSSNFDMVIWQYNADGTLDSTFDGNGIVVQDNVAGGAGGDYGFSITTDFQGRILVTGFSANSSGNADMIIWRYNADGTLDDNFDGDGIVVYDNAMGTGYYDYGTAIAIDSQGRILVTGWSLSSPNQYMTIWRYNP